MVAVRTYNNVYTVNILGQIVNRWLTSCRVALTLRLKGKEARSQFLSETINHVSELGTQLDNPPFIISWFSIHHTSIFYQTSRLFFSFQSSSPLPPLSAVHCNSQYFVLNGKVRTLFLRWQFYLLWRYLLFTKLFSLINLFLLLLLSL